MIENRMGLSIFPSRNVLSGSWEQILLQNVEAKSDVYTLFGMCAVLFWRNSLSFFLHVTLSVAGNVEQSLTSLVESKQVAFI